MSNLIHNEEVKLVASYFNNLSVGLSIAAIIALIGDCPGRC
jgi:hypothetical protein